jgi:hypothetical protein
MKNELTEIEKLIFEVEKNKNKLNQKKNILENIVKYEIEIANIQSEKKSIRQKKISFQINKNKLELHHKGLKIKPLKEPLDIEQNKLSDYQTAVFKFEEDKNRIFTCIISIF